MATVFNAYCPKTFLEDLQEALDIPGEVTKITLVAERDSFVQVSADFVAHEDQLDKVRAAFGDIRDKAS